MGLIIPKLCKNLLINLTILIAIASVSSTQSRQTTNKDVPKPKDDKYRPKIHFSIAEHWINDPNGMVYLDGEYHLHYQYFPEDSVWGPMHWGHSVSTDLVTWTDLPIALYPDDLGLIFSGSAVTDATNSSGFQTGSVTPIIAMFTHAGDVQAQSIAYSNDKARTFTKYEGNPVIRNPGMRKFFRKHL
jgi:fructan beta-fructosidase